MLTPPVARPLLLATAVSAGLVASVLVSRAPAAPPPPPPRPLCMLPVAVPPSPTLTARTSPRNGQIDVMSPDRYARNGTPDEVIDIALSSRLGVRDIFVNGNGGAHQWDTAIGADPIPFGRVYGGHRGDATWHVGVREHGTWVTNVTTGELPMLPAATRQLELIGDGVPDGYGPRTVTVMFTDGTTITAVVEDAPSNSYASQLGGGTGNGNAN